MKECNTCHKITYQFPSHQPNLHFQPYPLLQYFVPLLLNYKSSTKRCRQTKYSDHTNKQISSQPYAVMCQYTVRNVRHMTLSVVFRVSKPPYPLVCNPDPLCVWVENEVELVTPTCGEIFSANNLPLVSNPPSKRPKS